MEALAAHGDPSLQQLRKRVAASVARSACLASSSTVFGGPEEQEDLRRRMDEYMLHEEYHKSTVGEDGDVPLDALGSPPHTEMGSFLYSGPSTHIAETVSLPRQPRVQEHLRPWHQDLPTTSRVPEKSLGPLRPEPTHGALDRTAEPLAKLLSGSENPDVTALSEAVKAKLGITEPLPPVHTVVCTGGVCGLQWLPLAPYGSIGLPCGLVSTQRVYLWLYLVPNEQNHSMYS